ncbi:RNA-splicing factor [Ophidiomyces ophidiicola]|uniref:RNA-splicing factor n=1 Tax=Ophidiomyces ophidiicola TaxID=1387563 RepID=A0ACB8V3Z6_9EURO|nr:RNA-splicing factor [Ophidiomyces ophidiicola]KAI1911749.1 RNA-splicing factor [Ophidiomyces ophidiicola]KAI1914049.1 RNA-splicing factor [Ophidiomyces ophidiicola]KAI1929551.1 RNA-splicing factor [Ophidiomyces ophidiicola]KAI1943405.1 RNA-splicing factor [Ophidiomyces ophidiicola]KAI1951194.1 RNA-splicing factor [Ophidiomyces ophidiicola]
MSSNVGLSTPRGSGTSGYVQRNLSLLKPRDRNYGTPNQLGADTEDTRTFKQRQPDKQILEHDRRRQIEVKVMEERDRLEDENEELEERGEEEEDDDDAKGKKYKLSEEEIETKLDELRVKLTKELEDELAGRDYRGEKRKQGDFSGDGRGKRHFKTYQVHELAEAKIEESERFRKALGIRADGEEFPKKGGRRRDWDRPERADDRATRDRYRDDRDDNHSRSRN